MAQEKPKDAAKDASKDQPAEVGTKCAFSGVRLRRVKRYYRNGRYYINKRAFQEHDEQLKEKAEKEKPAETSQTPPAGEASAPQTDKKE